MYTTDQLRKKIENEILLYQGRKRNAAPENLYVPVSYALSAGGKRLRPVLVLLGYQIFENKIDKAAPTALAIEVFHNFTLLHDDIMDKAEIRRGMPTVHKKFSENSAILSGDAMAFLAYKLLLQTNTPNLQQLLSHFTETTLQVCEGQQFDMDFETRTDVSISEYLEMIRLKTAVLLGCALKCGAIIANAPDEATESLYEIGVNMGMAFQLQDDLLDSFGSEDELGKTIGGDIVSNKKTFLLIEALATANSVQRKELTVWLSKADFDHRKKVEAVLNIYNQLNIREKSEELILSYSQRALDLLETLPVASARKEPLTILCKELISRKK